MIVVAEGWRYCRRCLRFKRCACFNAKKRWPDGSIRWFQSYCKPCALQVQRDRNGWKRRRRLTDAQRKANQERRRQESLDRIMADPVRYAAYQATRRMDARLYRDRKRGAPPKEYPLHKTKAGIPVTDRYRPPSRYDVVPVEPFRRYLRETFRGWSPGEIASVHGGVIGRRLLEILNDKQDSVELDAVDRFLTIGMGRPDLLGALYPIEAP